MVDMIMRLSIWEYGVGSSCWRWLSPGCSRTRREILDLFMVATGCSLTLKRNTKLNGFKYEIGTKTH